MLALVTGATSGIGWAVSQELAASGASLLLTGRDASRLAALQKSLCPYTCVETMACDLSLTDGRRALLGWMRQRRPDLVVNNAGLGAYGKIWTVDEGERARILGVNIDAFTDILVESAALMRHAGVRGTILNVVSVTAFFPLPACSLYAATKAYQKALSEAMDVEYAPFGVRVLACCPGQVRTNFRRQASRGRAGDYPPWAMAPGQAAKLMLRQLKKGQRVRVIDWRTRLGLLALRLLPRSLQLWLIALAQEKLPSLKALFSESGREHD